MSIEKMKKLILMMESNNFNLDEYFSTDPSQGSVNLSPDEYDALLKSKDAKKIIKTLGKGYSAASDNDDLFRQSFSGKKVDVNIGGDGQKIKSLPNSVDGYVKEIYKLLKTHNMLSGDISDITFEASSYSVFTPSGKSEASALRSNDRQDIILFFTDDKLTKLNVMQYKIRSNYQNSDIANFIKDANSDSFKLQNNIKSASMRKNNYSIDIFFK